MNRTAPTLGRILTIVGFSLSCFALLVFLWISFGGSVPLQSKGYRVDVSFGDAGQLADRADVRVAGITIGKVVDQQADPRGNRTLATLELERRYAPLRSDARAILRQKTLLGETYVELTLGRKGTRVIPENGRLADDRVSPSVDFDELLRTFDPDTRRAFRQWQQSAAPAGRGRGQDFSDALGNLPVFTDSAQDVVSVLRRRREALASLVRGTGDTFGAITRNEAALRSLITDSDDVFSTLSARREALAQSVQILPTFLRESRATFSRLSRFSADTTPLIRDLGPVLTDAEPTARALTGLSPDLEALFSDLRPLITAGREGLPALGRVLRELDPTLAQTGPFLRQLNPILEFLEANQATVSDFLDRGPGTLGVKLPVPSGSSSVGHALPQIVVGGSQTEPAARRTADNRGNAYLPPGALASRTLKDPSRFAIPSFDCVNAGGEKAPSMTPGCAQAPGVPFQGTTRQFPNVQQAAPGGVSRQPGRGG